MIREILFRGKRMDSGEWETGPFVAIRDGTSTAEYFIADKMTGYHTPIDPSTVGQYTGLKDRNGKRIWEGDIVKDPGGEIFVVQWLPVSAAWEIQSDKHHFLCFMRYMDVFEVIGNIHDDKELLERGRE